MTVPFISFQEMDPLLEWQDITGAIQSGHLLPKASLADGFAYRTDDTLLSRSAWIDGLGVAVKAATVIPGNVPKGLPMIHGGVMVFNDEDGQLDALIVFHFVTKWKTAGDSLLGAKLLARPDSKNILIIGAGTVARNMVSAYASAFPDAKFTVWNRSAENALKMSNELEDHFDIQPTENLQKATEKADIITSSTMATVPFIDGAWLQEGQHLDLIGAYRPDMREANDIALQRARIFVDSFETTIDHIGELKLPILHDAIKRQDVLADYYDIEAGGFSRNSDTDITLFKNGGGAHMDLMTSQVILKKWRETRG